MFSENIRQIGNFRNALNQLSLTEQTCAVEVIKTFTKESIVWEAVTSGGIGTRPLKAKTQRSTCFA